MMNGTTSGSVQREPRADAKELTSRGQSLIVLLAAAREGECAAPSAGTGQLVGERGVFSNQPEGAATSTVRLTIKRNI